MPDASGLLKAVSGIYGPIVAGNIDIRTAEGCVWNLQTNCRQEYRRQDCWRLCLESMDQLSPGISTSGLLKAVSGIYGLTVARNIDIRTAEGCVWNLRTNCRQEYRHQDCWRLCLESTDQLSPGISTICRSSDFEKCCAWHFVLLCLVKNSELSPGISTSGLSPGISTSGLLKAVSRIYGPTVARNIDIRAADGCV